MKNAEGEKGGEGKIEEEQKKKKKTRIQPASQPTHQTEKKLPLDLPWRAIPSRSPWAHEPPGCWLGLDHAVGLVNGSNQTQAQMGLSTQQLQTREALVVRLTLGSRSGRSCSVG